MHSAARVHAGKSEDDVTDSEVSTYENGDDDGDRWGAVSFGSEDESEYSDEDDEDYDEQEAFAGRAIPNAQMMDLSAAVAAADAASAAVLQKCDDFTVDASGAVVTTGSRANMSTPQKDQAVRAALAVDSVSTRGTGNQRRTADLDTSIESMDLEAMIAQSERVADSIAVGSTPRK